MECLPFIYFFSFQHITLKTLNNSSILSKVCVCANEDTNVFNDMSMTGITRRR